MSQTESQARRGFKAPCPRCGEEAVSVALDDVETLRCGECNEELTLADVRGLVATWTAVLAWLDSAPWYPEATL